MSELCTVGPRIGAVRRMVTAVPGDRWASLRAWSSASILSAKNGSPEGARSGCFSVRKLGFDGSRAVEPGLRPEHELAHLGVPRRDRDVHRADALELVRPGGRVGGRRQKGEVCEGVDPLGREDLGDAGLGGGLRQVDLVRARLLAPGGCRFQVDGDDAADALVLLEHSDEVAAQKPRRRRSRRHNDASRSREAKNCLGRGR